MVEPTAYAMSQMFSQLTGKDVKFRLAPARPDNAIKQLFGEYSVAPGDKALMVKVDLPLIGSLAGALLGLPLEGVLERLKQVPLEEGLRDAIHEVLNVASTPISPEHRAVFRTMFADPFYCSEGGTEVLQSPDYKTHFDVSVEKYTGGFFSIFSRM